MANIYKRHSIILFFSSSLIWIHLFSPVSLSLVILAISARCAFIWVLLIRSVVTWFDFLCHNLSYHFATFIEIRKAWCGKQA